MQAQKVQHFHLGYLLILSDDLMKCFEQDVGQIAGIDYPKEVAEPSVERQVLYT